MTEAMRQSSIKSFLYCPRAFKYQQENIQPSFRNPAAVNGTVIHKILHMLHTENWSLNIDYLYLELFDQEEFHSDESHIPIFWKDDREKTIMNLKSDAVKMLTNYRNKDYNLYSEVILSEAKFTVKLGRAGLFSGTIDLLRRNENGEFELVDFKTSQFPPADTFLNVDYQLGIYTFACWMGVFKMPDGSLKTLNIPPEELSIIYYHLRDHLEYKRNNGNGKIGEEKGDPRRITRRTREQLSSMKRDLSAIVANIHRMSFPRNPGWSTCPFCQFAGTCSEDSNGELLNRNERKIVQELINQNKKEIVYDEN